MSDVREVFPILTDATDEGVSARAIQSGDSTAAKNGLLGFSYKDSSGNAVLPTLNTNGAIPTAEGAPGTFLSQHGTNAGSLTEVSVATITLTASKDYESISVNGSSFREAVFTVVFNNNGTPTVLDSFIVGAGDYNHTMKLDGVEFTSGATGTQQLILKAYNLQKASELRGRISAKEII